MNEVLKHVDGVMEARLSDSEVVLLGPASETYVGLDEIGIAVWERLRSPMSFEHLVRSLTEEYDAGADVISADVQRLIAEMVSHGLLERAPPAAAS